MHATCVTPPYIGLHMLLLLHPLISCLVVYTLAVLVSLIFGTVIPTSYNILMNVFTLVHVLHSYSRLWCDCTFILTIRDVYWSICTCQVQHNYSNQPPTTSQCLHVYTILSFTVQDGASPLYVASHNGHTDIVDLLLKTGADVHQTNKVLPLYTCRFWPTSQLRWRGYI